jgi:hypothetical protein
MAALIPGVLLLLTTATGPANEVDLDRLTKELTSKAKTTTDKVRAIVNWTNESFTWSATDYQDRGVAEIVSRKKGNCNEQALVVLDLLTRAGVKTRRVREINVQPASESRQRGAEDLIAKLGVRASVFGLRHNDHVWIEYRDDVTGQWMPADPTLNLVGLKEWVRARLGFGDRPTHAIIPSRDMLFPIAVFAVDGKNFANRSEHYLIDAFDSTYDHKLREQPAWRDWTKLIREIEPLSRDAFEGKGNLHSHADLIVAITNAYEKLRSAAK